MEFTKAEIKHPVQAEKMEEKKKINPKPE